MDICSSEFYVYACSQAAGAKCTRALIRPEQSLNLDVCIVREMRVYRAESR